MSQCGIALNRTSNKYNVVGFTYINIGLKFFKDPAEYFEHFFDVLAISWKLYVCQLMVNKKIVFKPQK